MVYTVGSVPYLNAKPLVKPLLWAGEASPVSVSFAVPSQLPVLLANGEVQAILVSSIAALAEPNSTVAAGLSISTQREVLSVRLFSKVPFDQIQTLAEDQSSMTSNALAKILLAELYGVHPFSRPMPPDASLMLESCDACILIGDHGMRFDGGRNYVLDLGQAWDRLTELPFVWAVWKGGEGLKPELVSHLQHALAQSQAAIDRVITESSMETGFSEDQCRHYLTEIMDYRLADRHLEGLACFGQLLQSHRLLDEAYGPRIVEAAARGSLLQSTPL
jgi:chorismate dehydratase